MRLQNSLESTSAIIPPSQSGISLSAIHPFSFLSFPPAILLRLRMFDCRVYVRPLCPPLDIAVSRSTAIIVWPSFSSIYPARRGMRHTYLLKYTCVYVYVYTSNNLRTTSHTSSFVVQFLRRVFVAFSPARLHSPARPKRIRSSARKGFPSIHANFNLFGYAPRPLPRWWGKSAFDDDNGEINETIGMRMTFKSRLHRHRSSLDLLGCSLVESFSS